MGRREELEKQGFGASAAEVMDGPDLLLGFVLEAAEQVVALVGVQKDSRGLWTDAFASDSSEHAMADILEAAWELSPEQLVIHFLDAEQEPETVRLFMLAIPEGADLRGVGTLEDLQRCGGEVAEGTAPLEELRDMLSGNHRHLDAMLELRVPEDVPTGERQDASSSRVN